MAVRLFVGNLPYDTTEAELREHFSPAGRMVSIYIATDRETGKPRGFAFIEFDDGAQAQEAVRRFNNQPFKGRSIAVNEARAREDRPARPAWNSAPPPDEPGGERPKRDFGPDRPPRRTRKPAGRGGKTERGPKGPIRERSGGRFFGGDDDNIDASEDISGENFASSEGTEEEGNE